MNEQTRVKGEITAAIARRRLTFPGGCAKNVHNGGCSSTVEYLAVDQGVAGSIPVSHPKNH